MLKDEYDKITREIIGCAMGLHKRQRANIGIPLGNSNFCLNQDLHKIHKMD
jgi:hypothetical protein